MTIRATFRNGYWGTDMKRPSATDWERRGDSVFYSAKLNLWYANGKVYDELSARHNGIIGCGALLKKIIQDENRR